MKIKKIHFKSTAALLFAGILVLFAISLVHADTCQIIRIDESRGGNGPRLEINPEKITVPVGTCTVWINWATGKDVQVSFRENAKACVESTGPVSEFKFEELKSGESCFISVTLPRGKTASLVWNKPGVYKYTLEAAPIAAVQGGLGITKILSEGVIEVK